MEPLILHYIDAIRKTSAGGDSDIQIHPKMSIIVSKISVFKFESVSFTHAFFVKLYLILKV